MARTSAAAIQHRTYPAFPAAPQRGGGEPGLFIAFFLRNPRGGGLPSDEAYLHGPVTNAQRLTSKAHMSDPRRRDARPSRIYGGEPEGRTPRRDAREPGSRRRGGDGRGRDDATSRMPAQTGLTQPIARQPGVPQPGVPLPGVPLPGVPLPGVSLPGAPGRGEVARRGANGAAAEAANGAGRSRANGAGRSRANGAGRSSGRGAGRSSGRGAGRSRGDGAVNGARRPRGTGGRLSRVWEGSLNGGLGICVIVGSAAIGTVATIVTRAVPGSVLGLFVLAGTVAAALTVQPRTGRLIFPVPALSYLVGALASGVVYDRSANKTELAVGAAQWVANGFFVM